MEGKECEDLLLEHGVKLTANRILVVRELAKAGCPLSQTELERRVLSLDKSVISRTLALFREHHVVHTVEGTDGFRYELCRSHSDEHDDDMHIHFYCEQCGRTFCFEHLPVPSPVLPDGFQVKYVNYVVKGLCPECALSHSRYNTQLA